MNTQRPFQEGQASMMGRRWVGMMGKRYFFETMCRLLQDANDRSPRGWSKELQMQERR